IAAHSDIAPGRKSDPGPAFDWLRLYDGLSSS
ncbi:MAG: 1,6-anhydro-N-acetylmuramyl-L-alanine amidase AmpD, partial [Woeseiaceae bacterium]